MISKNMYRVLKRIPQYPETVSLAQLQQDRKIRLNLSLLSSIIEDALDCHYIITKRRTATDNITTLQLYISECGQVAIEEYCDHHTASVKSTWALIVSGLSLLSSIVAIIISCV